MGKILFLICKALKSSVFLFLPDRLFSGSGGDDQPELTCAAAGHCPAPGVHQEAYEELALGGLDGVEVRLGRVRFHVFKQSYHI